MTSPLVRLLRLPALVLLALACSDESPDGIKVPITGGTVTADSSRVTLVVPNGALSGDTHIDIQRGPAPNDPTLVGDRSYEVAPEGLRLSSPATVTLRPVGSLPAGVARDEIAIAVSVGGTVTEVPAAVDGAAGTVSAALTTLGDLWIRRLHVSRVTLDRAATQLDVGRTLQVRATALAGSGRTLLSPLVTWSSDNQAVAVVGPETGLVSAMGTGTARITARSEGKEETLMLTVVRRTVRSVQVVGSQTGALFPGETATYTAILRDSVGDPIERAPTWISRNPDVATVTAGGIVTAIAPGLASIEATADGAVGNVLLTVRPTPVRFVSVISQETGESMPLNALSGSVVVEVAVNPDRTAREVSLSLACPNRPEVPIVAHPHESMAPGSFALAFHTAAYDEATGMVRTPNGACQLRSRLSYTNGAASEAAPLAVTLSNTSRFVARSAVTDSRSPVLGIGPVTRATGADLFERRAGAVTLELLALNYAPAAQITSISGTYLGRTFTVGMPQPGTSRYQLEFPNVPVTTDPLGIAEYTSPVVGDVPTITSMSVTGGSAFTTVQATPLRIDNASPSPPALFTLAGATMIGGQPWVPATYSFDRPQVFVAGGETVDGVGGTRVEFHGQRTTEAGLPNGSATGAACAAGTLVKVTTAGELRALRPAAVAATANEFRLRAVEWDKLGNVRCTELGTTFGVEP